MTANDSSLSATSRLEVDLAASGRLAPLAAAFLAGRDLDLLEPLRSLPPGELPPGEPPPTDRRELARALGAANAAWGHPRAAELAERLADAATLVTVTGQQPGLYGGPLLALTKMAATVRYAEALAAAGRPAVPVFWVATEDHDWRELTRVAVLTRAGTKSYDLGDDDAELAPVGLRTFDERLADLERRIADDLGSEAAAERFRGLSRWYRPGAGFGDAFCRLFVELLGERAPLFLDSMDPDVKRLQRPWLRRLVERRREVDQALVRASGEVERRGYSPQVRYEAGECPLFLVEDGRRRRVLWQDEDGFTLRGGGDEKRPLERLLAAIDERPETVSPGVLARPAIQDALLGTTLQVMGPAETSYLAQAKAVYRELEVPAPWTTLRPQALVLEARQVEHLVELGVSLEEVLDKGVEEILADKLGEDLVTPAREKLEATLDELGDGVLGVDATLEKPMKKTRDQIGRALDQLASKIAAAVARRNEVWNRRLGQVQEACRPEGHLQERHLTVAHYVARYGPSFVEAYWSDFDLDPRRLQVLTIRPVANV